jgi:hypothetical protein
MNLNQKALPPHRKPSPEERLAGLRREQFEAAIRREQARWEPFCAGLVAESALGAFSGTAGPEQTG